MKYFTLWLWASSLLLSCLPDKAGLDTGHSAAHVRLISAFDPNGAAWPMQSVSRLPRLKLELEPIPPHPERKIWLVRGTIDGPLAADLEHSPPHASSKRRIVPLIFVHEPDGLNVTPAARLTPGERYTLIVLRESEPNFEQELTVSASPAAGAALIASLPADEARDVPPNLRSVLLRFDGYLASGSVRPSLKAGPLELALSSDIEPCGVLGLSGGDCLAVRPTQPLPPGQTITLSLATVTDATGAALDPILLSFRTGHTRDELPPSLAPLPCGLDERELNFGGCLLEQDRGIALRLASREATSATLRLEHRSQAVWSVHGSIALTMAGLEPGATYAAGLRVTDLAGNLWTHALPVHTPRDLATLSIDEVRVDPLGPEPSQESVELLNHGSEQIQIMGFFLSDQASEPGLQVVDDLKVLPGERVLVVGPSFDAQEPSDGALPPGIRLAHVNRPLSLANDGEALYLRDAKGRRLSAAPRMRPEREGACIARRAEDPRTGELGSFAHDPNATCTQGRETTWR